jgi:hypothetical protein
MFVKMGNVARWMVWGRGEVLGIEYFLLKIEY